MLKYVIEDEIHAELHGEYATEHEALVELRRRAEIPWDKEPNKAPCTSWRNCGRAYYIREYNDAREPGVMLRRSKVLEISASQVKWHDGLH